MADVAYNIFKTDLMKGTINLEEAGDDIRVLLLEANSDINVDDTTVQAVLARAGTTELTSTGYSRQALGSQTVTQDDTDDEGVFDAANTTFSSVSQAGSETIVGGLVFKFVTNDAGSTPIGHFDVSPAITPNGSDITITWNTEGIVNLT